MKPIAYPVRLKRDEDGGFVVDFPDLGGFTYGENEEEALHNAHDLLETILTDKIKEGVAVKKPSTRKNMHYIHVPPAIAVKLLVQWEMQKTGMRTSTLARKLNVQTPKIESFFSSEGEYKISQIEKIFAVFGKQVVIGIEDLAY